MGDIGKKPYEIYSEAEEQFEDYDGLAQDVASSGQGECLARFQEYRASFNAQQLAAIESKSKATLVVAGAGSGKTRVIVGRVMYLHDIVQVSLNKILVITFTNKAAHELKERFEKLLGLSDSRPLISTFHAFCVYLIKCSGFFSKNFTILDQEDQLDLVARIIKQNNLGKNFTARNVLSMISKMKNSQVNQDLYGPLEQDLCRVYQKELDENCCLDFDDLLLKVCAMAQENPEFVQYLQRRFRHVLIDEYQDTNFIQHKLIKLLALEHPKAHSVGDSDFGGTAVNKGQGNKALVIDSVFAVGDQDQSIYSWRGALVSNIADFKKDFGSVYVCKLERNYRSTAEILDLANKIIKFNSSREDKTLWTDKVGSGSILSFELENEWAEAQLVVHAAYELYKRNNKAQLVILLRANYQSRVLEEKLIERALTYKIYGGVKFYERKEVKDCLAYLKLCVNPFDKISFARVINVPMRGLGNVFVKNFFDLCKTYPGSNLFEVLSLALSGELKLSKVQTESLEAFFKVFDNLGGESHPAQALKMILDRTRFFESLTQNYDKSEAEDRRENVEELLRLCQNLEINKVLTPEGEIVNTLADFLTHVALVEQTDEREGERFATVVIMTIHAAKGLEFQNVAVIGLQEGYLPHKNSLESTRALEEECRLLYVAITRAKERLLLTMTRNRNSFDGMVICQPSRFLTQTAANELSTKVVEFVSEGLTRALGTWFSGELFLVESSFMDKRAYTSSLTSGQKFKVETSTVVQGEVQNQPNSAAVIGAAKCFSRFFKKGCTVEHMRFGKGIVNDAVKDDVGNLYLTVNFKSGEKKLLSSFVKMIE